MNNRMKKDDVASAIAYIESQLENGYVDLGSIDEDEMTVIKEAIRCLKWMMDVCETHGMYAPAEWYGD